MKKNKILIVDDEPDIREILRFNLENEDYEIDEAESASEADKVLSKEHDLILLDVMMEGESGFQYAARLRKEGNSIPIIFLTAKDTENDLLTGFSIGGDDYISKPFSVKEVLARVKSVLKRQGAQSAEGDSTVLKINDLVIDKVSKQVEIDGETVPVTRTEWNILLLLIENQGKVFSRAAILENAWDEEGFVLERTVDVHIARLRKKMGKYASCLINRTGYGYTFKI